MSHRSFIRGTANTFNDHQPFIRCLEPDKSPSTHINSYTRCFLNGSVSYFLHFLSGSLGCNSSPIHLRAFRFSLPLKTRESNSLDYCDSLWPWAFMLLCVCVVCVSRCVQKLFHSIQTFAFHHCTECRCEWMRPLPRFNCAIARDTLSLKRNKSNNRAHTLNRMLHTSNYAKKLFLPTSSATSRCTQVFLFSK